MKQKTHAELLAEVQRHITGNRKEIEQSKYAECIACCAVFDAKEVQSWRDEWTSPEKQNRVNRWTALCPRCTKPSVVGSCTGLLDDPAYIPFVNTLLASLPRKRR